MFLLALFYLTSSYKFCNSLTTSSVRGGGSGKCAQKPLGGWGETGTWSLEALFSIPHSGIPTAGIPSDWSILTVYFNTYVNHFTSRGQNKIKYGERVKPFYTVLLVRPLFSRVPVHWRRAWNKLILRLMTKTRCMPDSYVLDNVLNDSSAIKEIRYEIRHV